MEKTKFYQELVKPYREEMMKSLKEFIAIDSVYDENTRDEANPFGKGVSKALKYIEEMAKKDGFIVNNYDNYLVEILTNDLEKNVTIMAHTDIVPVGRPATMPMRVHRINPDKCVKCGLCMSNCRFGAIIKD